MAKRGVTRLFLSLTLSFQNVGALESASTPKHPLRGNAAGHREFPLVQPLTSTAIKFDVPRLTAPADGILSSEIAIRSDSVSVDPPVSFPNVHDNGGSVSAGKLAHSTPLELPPHGIIASDLQTLYDGTAPPTRALAEEVVTPPPQISPGNRLRRTAINGVWWGAAIAVPASGAHFLASNPENIQKLIFSGWPLMAEITLVSAVVVSASAFRKNYWTHVLVLVAGTAGVLAFMHWLDLIPNGFHGHGVLKTIMEASIFALAELAGLVCYSAFSKFRSHAFSARKLVLSLRTGVPYLAVSGAVYYFDYLAFWENCFEKNIDRLLGDLGILQTQIVLLEVLLVSSFEHGVDLRKNIAHTLRETARTYPIFFLYWLPAMWLVWNAGELASLSFTACLAVFSFFWSALLFRRVEAIVAIKKK